MDRYVAYYRVSTEKQGRSGLGLDAQRAAIQAFVRDQPLVGEHTDIESGKNNDRPALKRALAEARAENATLVIAKLDRLARSVSFIAALMESGIRFVAADMPEANSLTLHIMSAVAQYEREAISQRTKAALAAASARGIKLGNPNPAASLERGKATLKAKADEFAQTVYPLIVKLREAGAVSFRDVARALNRHGIKTARGKEWTGSAVRSAESRTATVKNFLDINPH